MLRVEELDRLLVDLHILAVGDGRRLGRTHEMAPAPRKPGGVELLEGGMMVLEGVHLGEVVVPSPRRPIAGVSSGLVWNPSGRFRSSYSSSSGSISFSTGGVGNRVTYRTAGRIRNDVCSRPSQSSARHVNMGKMK